MTRLSILARPSASLALTLALSGPAAAQWSQALLSAERSDLSATSVGHLALFAGDAAADRRSKQTIPDRYVRWMGPVCLKTRRVDLEVLRTLVSNVQLAC